MELKEDECAIVANTQIDIYKKVLSKNPNINLFGRNLKLHKKVIDGFMEIYKEPVEFNSYIWNIFYSNIYVQQRYN